MTSLKISAASHVGCVRHKNEDMILVDTLFLRNEDCIREVSLLERDRYLVAVADGMGGHTRGEIASEETLHNLQYVFGDIPSELSAGDLNEVFFGWLESINHILESKGQADETFRGMGTTLVALVYYCGHFYWLNCGDSRLYRFRDGTLTQLTTDHSLSNLMGRQERSSIITNCIGGGCNTSYIDIVQCTKDLMPGDKLLLCSDGLSDMMPDEKIAKLLTEGCDANKLCNAAIYAGGFDNVSVCVVEIN